MSFINRKNFINCFLVTGCIIATAPLMPIVLGSALIDNVKASDATILGKPHITGYEPMKDASGGTIIASAVAAMTFPLSGIIAEHHDHDHGYQFGDPCWTGPIWVCGGDWDY